MADSNLTSREIVQKPDIIIDPNFPAPPGVAEVRYGDDNTNRRISEYGDGGAEGSPGGALDPGEGEIDPVTGEYVGPKPGTIGTDGPGYAGITFSTPSIIGVSNERVRFDASGVYLVDATLEFTEIDTAKGYEVRVSKL